MKMYEFSLQRTLSISIVLGVLGFGLLAVPWYQKTFGEDGRERYFSKTKMLVSSLRYRVAFAQASDADLFASLFSLDNNSTQQGTAAALPVLVYHGVGEAAGAITPEQFRDQMFALKKAGYSTVSADDARAFLRGEKELPDRSFLLTFDDGRRDSFEPVDPILHALGWRAVNFIVTGFSFPARNNYYLGQDDLVRMLETGRWEIQSHGQRDHEFYPIDRDGTQGLFLPNKLWVPTEGRIETDEEFRARVRYDLEVSKKELEESFGRPIHSFAFPYGDYGDGSKNYPEAIRVVPALVGEFYDLAFYQIWSGNDYVLNYPRKDTFLAKRIVVSHEWSGEHLVGLLEDARPKPLPYAGEFFNSEEWVVNWGHVNISNNRLTLGGSTSAVGSTVFLEGSYPWQDYTFLAHVERSEGRSRSLIARFKDSHNYVACNYTGDLIHIDQTLDGETRTIRGVTYEDEILQSNYELGIRVKGRSVECLINGDVVASTPFLDHALDRGGVGFKVWDAVPGKAVMLVDSMSVDAAR